MINFSEVERSVQTLKKQYAAGQIDQSTFETKLMELIDVAEDGYYWMFGYKSETWYRHDGTRWVSDHPGELIEMLSQNETLSRGNNTHKNYRAEAAGPDLLDWQTLDWNWFVISLVFIGLIAWIVYASV